MTKATDSTPFSYGLGRRSEQVLLDLRKRILAGEYEPGDKLPREVDLCGTYGASRSTIRRAVARLVEAGLVRVKKRAGMFVCDPLPVNANAVPETRTIAIMALGEMERLRQAQQYAVGQGYPLSFYFQFERHFDMETERAFLEAVVRERYRALLAVCSPLGTDNDDLLVSWFTVNWTNGCRV